MVERVSPRKEKPQQWQQSGKMDPRPPRGRKDSFLSFRSIYDCRVAGSREEQRSYPLSSSTPPASLTFFSIAPTIYRVGSACSYFPPKSLRWLELSHKITRTRRPSLKAGSTTIISITSLSEYPIADLMPEQAFLATRSYW